MLIHHSPPPPPSACCWQRWSKSRKILINCSMMANICAWMWTRSCSSTSRGRQIFGKWTNTQTHRLKLRILPTMCWARYIYRWTKNANFIHILHEKSVELALIIWTHAHPPLSTLGDTFSPKAAEVRAFNDLVDNPARSARTWLNWQISSRFCD